MHKGPELINLLPWRELYRERKRREFLALLSGFAVLAMIVVLLSHFYFSMQIKQQKQRNDYLQIQITQLNNKLARIRDLKKQKQTILARMRVIVQLQQYRFAVVRLLDELPKLIPDGIHLSLIQYRGHFLTVEGETESNARVSQLMRNFEASKWFKQPQLTEIKLKTIPTEAGNRFRLTVTQIIQQPPQQQKSVPGQQKARS